MEGQQSTEKDEVGGMRADGQLLVGHGDDFQGHTMAMGAEIRTTHGAVRLKIPANKHTQFR